MAFRYESMVQIGVNRADIPACYSYNTMDNLETVSQANYFNDPRLEAQEGDVLFCNTASGRTQLTFVNSTSVEPYSDPSSGWSQYADTEYPNAGAAFSVLANVDTIVPNNALAVLDSQKPADIDSFYDGSVIKGFNQSSLLITIDLVAIPTSVNTTYIEFWFDIGGGIPPLYRRIISFPKGNGVARPISYTTFVYTLDTWEANGATVYCRANGTADLHSIRYIISRNHKGR